MENMKKMSQYLVYLGAYFVYKIMATISESVPLAGDDWGYALNLNNESAFERAWTFYFTWSGRFFSELYGFLMAPNKELWNVFNPILFAVLFCVIIKLVAKKNTILCGLALIALMFSVDQVLRVETYSWLMGTTYVIPLVLFLIYLNLIKPVVLESKQLKAFNLIICCVLNFIICLSMENIAAVLLVGNILMMGYIVYYTKSWKHPFLSILIISLIGVCLIRLSPGAAYRTMNEHSAFIELGLFGQIALNWENFLRMTFVNNQTMMIAFSTVLAITTLIKAIKTKKFEFYCYFLIQLIALFINIAEKIYNVLQVNILLVFFDLEYTSSTLWILSLFYIVYIVGTLVTLYKIFETKQERAESMFYMMIAGSANMVMMISPIFGSRSSLYTVYFIFVLTLYLISKLKIDIKYQVVFSLMLLYFIHIKYEDLMAKYHLVDLKDEQRMEIIEYYVDHPEDLNVWIPRMPEGLVHSADIEFGDDYHFEVFKKYYGINEEAIVTFSHDVGK